MSLYTILKYQNVNLANENELHTVGADNTSINLIYCNYSYFNLTVWHNLPGIDLLLKSVVIG